MRIISGKYKGKKLIGFDIIGTRPTMSRVRESLFATIQNNLKNSIVLDLFAGTGSLGIESLSNGSKCCYFIDNNKQLIDIINKNIEGIKEEIHVIKSDYEEALNNLKNTKFDIIFLDPPYKLNLINNCLDKIYKYDMLNEDGIIVCEYESENVNSDNFNLIKTKKYGSKLVKIYQKKPLYKKP